MADNYIIQQPFNFHLDNLKQLHILKKHCDSALIKKDIISYSNSMDAFLISCYQFLTVKQLDKINDLIVKIKDNPINIEGEYIIYDATLWQDLKELHKQLTICLKVNGISFANLQGNKGIDGQRMKHGLSTNGNNNNNKGTGSADM